MALDRACQAEQRTRFILNLAFYLEIKPGKAEVENYTLWYHCQNLYSIRLILHESSRHTDDELCPSAVVASAKSTASISEIRYLTVTEQGD